MYNFKNPLPGKVSLLEAEAALAHMRNENKISVIRADGGTVSPEVQKLIAKIDAGLQDMKAKIEAGDTKIAALEAATASDSGVKEALQTAQDAAKEAAKAMESLKDMQQAMADQLAQGNTVPAKTVGEMLVASQSFIDLSATLGDGKGKASKPMSGWGGLRFEANTITGQSGSPANSDSTLVPPDRRAGIIPGASRALRIADVLNRVETTSNLWQFTRELALTNNAAEVAEGAAKPESSITFEMAEVNIRTIATWLKASVQILADAPGLRSYIDGRLRYMVDAREDYQLLNGDGTGQNISGMLDSGNFTAFTPSTGNTAIDSLNVAKYAIWGADWAPTAIIMNPADWGKIERLKTEDATYVVGNPFGFIQPMMWGLPVVLSNNMPAGKFLMADFQTAYDYVARQETVVELGYADDDFIKNLVTLRAEKRSALATVRPASTRYGNLIL